MTEPTDEDRFAAIRERVALGRDVAYQGYPRVAYDDVVFLLAALDERQ